MANNYITIDDITNSLFSKITSDTTKQVYVDKANEECESLAQTFGIMDTSDISMPVGFTVKEYLVNIALYKFAGDYIGANQVEVSDSDIYKLLFDRSLYLVNRFKPEITYEMLTNTVVNRYDRSVSFGRTVRG